MEKYNRASCYFADIRPAVTALFNDYLQMPEGKLVSSKDKNKVLSWLNSISSQENSSTADATAGDTAVSISKWVVETVDSVKQTMTLYNLDNAEIWKEHIPIEESKYVEILQLYEEQDMGSCVLVELCDDDNSIFSINTMVA